MDMHSFLVVISNDYIPQYKSLLKSIRRWNPAQPVICAIYGDADQLDKNDSFQIILDVKKIPELRRDQYPQEYDTGTYIAAIRWKLMEYCFREYSIEVLAFLGADMYFYGPASTLFSELPANRDFGVTPHVLTAPPKDGKFPNMRMLQLTGHLNADCILMRNTTRVRSFINWVAKELETHCVPQYRDGIFFDQTFLGFCYVFLPNLVHTITKLGINAAYYNLHERTIKRIGDSLFIEESSEPLLCFQFSGFNGASLSKYLQRKEQLSSVVCQMALDYMIELEDNGKET